MVWFLVNIILVHRGMSCLMFCITMVHVVISILIKYTVTSLHPVTFTNVTFTESIQYTKRTPT